MRVVRETKMRVSSVEGRLETVTTDRQTVMGVARSTRHTKLEDKRGPDDEDKRGPDERARRSIRDEDKRGPDDDNQRNQCNATAIRQASNLGQPSFVVRQRSSPPSCSNSIDN